MEVFPKYDDLNASVQENVSAIRVVKAYVREDYEKNKFRKASQNIYNMFVKAESILAFNNPVMQITVYSCILAISWVGAKMIVGGYIDNRRTDESSYLLYEYHDESDDAVHGVRHAGDECGKRRAYL